MCGITGYFGSGNSEILKGMTDKIRYRGPDAEGFYVDSQVGLGHRRLSIIDLTDAGRQPMTNEDQSVYVVFNGEIYNYQEHRDELIQKGHRFVGDSDTEVIVHLYEECGDSVFSKLNGMFAIAIYDKNENRLLLARDRAGQKPLYWYFKNGTLVFASEIKSIISHPSVDREIDRNAVYQYFSFDYVPQPNTIFKGIAKLENGQVLTCHDDRVDLKYYYQFEIAREQCDHSLFEGLLDDSIRRRLVADVPLGVFLSGGIDSSVIAYYSKRYIENLQTFSVGFKEKSYDESIYAKEVAKLLNTDHYHKEFTPAELIKAIPEVIEKLDEPFGDPSLLPTFLLCKFAKEKVTVALSGDGGDEVLMGYPNYKAQKLLHFSKLYGLKFNPRIVDALLGLLPFSDENLSKSFILQRALLAGQFSGLYRDFIAVGAYNNSLGELLNNNNRGLFNFVDDFLSDYKSNNYLEKAILLFQKYYLSDDILYKADRASMYNSLEVRAPFLDYRLIDYLNNMPLRSKLRGLNAKYILKETMVNKLPEEILKRKKKGFGVPLTRWFRADLKEFMLSSLHKSEIEKSGLIDYKIVEKLVDQHLNEKVDNKKILWSLIVFQNWYRQFC